MLSAIKDKFNKINETYYNIGYVIITILFTTLATIFGFAPAEIVAGILIKSTIFSLSAITFLKALMGPEVSVHKEILENKNVALAVLAAGFLCGLGFSISGL